MDSPHRQAEIRSLIAQLQKKNEQMEEARNRDVIFEEKKKLYLEMKELSKKLQQVLEQLNLESKKM